MLAQWQLTKKCGPFSPRSNTSFLVITTLGSLRRPIKVSVSFAAYTGGLDVYPNMMSPEILFLMY